MTTIQSTNNRCFLLSLIRVGQDLNISKVQSTCILLLFSFHLRVNNNVNSFRPCHGYFMPSFVEIGPLVVKLYVMNGQYLFAVSLQITSIAPETRKLRVPLPNFVFEHGSVFWRKRWTLKRHQRRTEGLASTQMSNVNKLHLNSI